LWGSYERPRACMLTLPWVQSWRPDPSVLALTPADWYTIGHGLSASYTLNIDGIPVPLEHPSVWFLCAPPPAAARTTLAELAASRHKRPHLNHIVLLPRLFTSEWRRQLHKLADAIGELPAGSRACWLVGLILCFSACPPWQLRSHPHVLALVRELQSLWPRLQANERPVLRQLCVLPGVLESML